MGCLNCFRSKVGGDDVGPNKLRENLSTQASNEKSIEKTLTPKTSNEPTVEEVEHSRDRTQGVRSFESRANSAIITRDFGAIKTDSGRASKQASPIQSPILTNNLSPTSTNNAPLCTAHESPTKGSEDIRPPRSTSLGPRAKSRSRSRSPLLRTDSSPTKSSPFKEDLQVELSPLSVDSATANETKAYDVAQGNSLPASLAAVEQKKSPKEERPTLSIIAHEHTKSQPLIIETGNDARGLSSLKSQHESTDTEGAMGDDHVAATIPLPASPSSPTSPRLPSLSTSVPSVSDTKSPSTLSPPSMDDSNIRRLSQDSTPGLPSDFLADDDKKTSASTTTQEPALPPEKVKTPKSPPLLIPQAQSSPRPSQQNIPVDAPTPTSATSMTRPDNLLRMSTAPTVAPPSPNTKADKRKSRLSRFLSTGGVNKRKSQAMPAAKDLKTIEDMPPTPKYIPPAVPSEKKQVRDVKSDEKEMQQKEVELETAATIDSVTGRTWKDDGDNDSLFCY